MANTLSIIISNLQTKVNTKLTSGGSGTLSSLTVTNTTIPSGGTILYDDNTTGNIRNTPYKVGCKNSDGVYVRYHPFRLIPPTNTSTYGIGFAIDREVKTQEEKRNRRGWYRTRRFESYQTHRRMPTEKRFGWIRRETSIRTQTIRKPVV